MMEVCCEGKGNLSLCAEIAIITTKNIMVKEDTIDPINFESHS